MKRKLIYGAAALVLVATIGALGANARHIEEFALGGGYGHSTGGADFEKDGTIKTNGPVTIDDSLTVGDGSTSDPTINFDGSANDGILFFDESSANFVFDKDGEFRKASGNLQIGLAGAAGTFRYHRFATGATVSNSTRRWDVGVLNDSESGSDAGSTLYIRAFGDGGSLVDTPVEIKRASGGNFLLRRPFVTQGDVDVQGGDLTNTTGNLTYNANSGAGSHTFQGSKVEIQTEFVVKRTGTATAVNSANESIIGVTDTGSPRTITLDTDDVIAGRVVIVKDESGAAGTNNITVATEGSQTIDGAATVVISTNYGVTRVYSDGTDWFTF